MVEHGDLFYSRNVNFLTKALGKIIVFFLRTSLKEKRSIYTGYIC